MPRANAASLPPESEAPGASALPLRAAAAQREGSQPDPVGPGVLYLQVKRRLLERIESQEWRPGACLPNETTLAAQLQVSIGTLRRAVDELVQAHVLVRRQGKGTFVVLHSRDRYLFQFFRVQERGDPVWAGRETSTARDYPQVETLSFDRARADEATAAALHLRVGAPVFQIQNRLSLAGRPVVLDRLAISADLFKGLTERRFREREGTVYKLYQTDFGITVLHAQERARAVLAPREAVRHLGVPTGQPMIEVQRLALSFGERPVELRTSLVWTERHDYAADVRDRD